MAGKIIAQKFGGTSVATPDSRRLVVKHVRRTVAEGYRLVVVVSAMGRRGAPYATDTLLDLIHLEGEPVAERDEDLIFHCGEIISASIVSHLLKLSGIPAVALTGAQAQIYTDGCYRRGKIVRINPTRMLHYVDEGTIPVVTGGQGVSVDGGEVNILGRGASDTSGVAVGIAVGAEKVEIYTDVPGVAIADPRLVPEAPFLPEMSYSRLYEVGMLGARVVHPGAVLAGQSAGTPIVCRSTFDELPGTLITEAPEEPPLVGIPCLGPVDLLVLPENALEGIYSRTELYDPFAAVALKDESHGRTIVAVDRGWRAALENCLSSAGVDVEEVHSGQGLVSLIGAPDFIAETAARAKGVPASLGMAVSFEETTELRRTFAVAHGDTPDLIRAFYREFAPWTTPTQNSSE